MILSTQKKMKCLVLMTALMMALLVFCPQGLNAGICEDAMNKCMYDNSYGGYLGSGYCIIGYFFCKKYVDKK